MTAFALVHGAWHGAWCWDRLTPALEQRNHRVVAMDLPCDDGSATFDDYADVVCAAIADCPADDLVLVGHSLGGQTVARVATRRRVRHVVYLSAVPPAPGRSLLEDIAEGDMLDPDYLNGLSDEDSEGRSTWVDPEVATRVLFGDCDRSVATAAFARLRPQGRSPFSLLFEHVLPEVDSTYVVCADDRLVNPGWSKRIARERLGIDPIELPGSHSPFLSRPDDLAELLHGLTPGASSCAR